MLAPRDLAIYLGNRSHSRDMKAVRPPENAPRKNIRPSRNSSTFLSHLLAVRGARERPILFARCVCLCLLAPHTSGPRDVPRCGALSLLQKDAALQGGDPAETAVG